MDYVPLAIGAAVGLTDGILGQTTFGSRLHVRSYFRGAVFLGGLVGELTGKVSEDLSYGLMTSGITLLGSRVPAGFFRGSAGAFPLVGAGAGAAGPDCVSCGQGALIVPSAPAARLGSYNQRAGRVA